MWNCQFGIHRQLSWFCLFLFWETHTHIHVTSFKWHNCIHLQNDAENTRYSELEENKERNFLFLFCCVFPDTITAVFRTNFRMDFPFDLAELLVYAAMGAACGVLGAAFVYLHKRIVLFNRKHKRMSAFLQRNRFLYPLIITTLISSVTFPPFLGKFMASEVSRFHAFYLLFKHGIHWSYPFMINYYWLNWPFPSEYHFSWRLMRPFMICSQTSLGDQQILELMKWSLFKGGR